jgi:soluble lytic murein transglycosylase
VSATRRARRTPARRRVIAVLAFLIGVAIAVIVLTPLISGVVRELRYPLSDAAEIRQQARIEHLDPALVAAVIYAETKFDARTSSAGALGLMQILPATARDLAHMSGGTLFKVADLAHPTTNIAYGSYYLRYLLNVYHGNLTLALAAYNAGLANVDRWVTTARARGQALTVDAIPFPQTRAYVVRVEAATKTYRRYYAKQLGPP